MKLTSLIPPVAAASLLVVVVFAAAAVAQAPQDQPAPPTPPAAAGSPQQGAPPAGHPMRNYPAPTNLKVLPKNLSGREVRDMMEKWAGSLGVHCDTCHAADPKNIGPNGRPRLNFADDSKPDKQIARLMYTMTEQMNKEYIRKAMEMDTDDEGSPVTCGTCHRGHKMPEEFVIPREERKGEPGEGREEHPAPAGEQPHSN